jgi:hypothetical protein
VGSGGPPGGSHLYRLDVTERSVVRLGEPADHLVIEPWPECTGLRTMTRR